MKINVVIPCAGKGERAGLGYNKTLALLGEKPVVRITAECFSLPEITRIVIVHGQGEREYFASALAGLKNTVLVCGGATRSESVAAGIDACESDCTMIAVHDGARPFLRRDTLLRGIEVCADCKSAVPVLRLSDSLRQVDGENSRAVDRDCYRSVQTPQIFDAGQLRRAYSLARAEKINLTDDAQIYERYIGSVTLYEGDRDNVKLTHKSDFALRGVRVGCGFDTHTLTVGRKLILGGVDIPHSKGLLGHSDADVLVHAIMDALLSCIHGRDIGVLFPDSDEKYAGISSMRLLEGVKQMLDNAHAEVLNVSAVIMAQRPKLKDYIPQMCKNLACALDIREENVSISATTTEGIGLVGREEGISCHATAAVYINSNGNFR